MGAFGTLCNCGSYILYNQYLCPHCGRENDAYRFSLSPKMKRLAQEHDPETCEHGEVIRDCVCKLCGKAHVHDWDGCKCKRCGTVRNEGHEWDGCKCKRCGETRDEQHEWAGCSCNRCGAEKAHDWDGCKCKRCGKEHDWKCWEFSFGDEVFRRDYECKRCRIYGYEDCVHGLHDWDGCVCRRCGKEHDWTCFDLGPAFSDLPELRFYYACTRCGKEIKTNDDRATYKLNAVETLFWHIQPTERTLQHDT